MVGVKWLIRLLKPIRPSPGQIILICATFRQYLHPIIIIASSMGNTDLKNDLGRIVQKTMADVVEIRLREYLKEKSFKPGDALPKELDLADSLGVSRNVVREALSRLRMLGMVETRKKRGMVLARPDILSSFERVLDPLIIGD